MLRRISRIQGFRIFREFKWPAELAEFGRFNLIYGLNGTGKTTLSTLFRHVEKQQPITDGRVDFVFEDGTVCGADLHKQPVPKVRVFNRDFVGRAVFETGGGRLPPVYYFGEGTAEKQKRIVELTEQLNTAKAEHARHTETARQAVKSLEDYCTETARGIRNLLTVPGGGRYNNYDARSFKQQAQRIQNAGDVPARLVPDLREAHLTLRGSKALPSVQPLTLRFPDLLELRLKIDEVLRASVVSSVLEDLATDQVVAGWVGQGLALHSGDRLSSTCRFCLQPLEAERIHQIEDHFNDEFKRLKQRVASLISEVDEAMALEGKLTLPPEEALYETLRPQYREATKQLRSHMQTVGNALKALRSALVEKHEDPFQKIELESWLKMIGPGKGFGHTLLAILAVMMDGAQLMASSAGAQALAGINSTINEHNRLTESFDVEVNVAIDAIALDEVLVAFAGWRERADAMAAVEAAAKAAGDRVKEFTAEIAALESAIKQHHRPAEELNHELAGYLGRSELKFVPEQNGYQLMRGGQAAQHLSDGERTAVAFLYFLKSLQGTDFDLKDGIVVIDDPVSSLDANSLFSAFGYMKARNADAKQLFILTHNFSFFRQVHNWFKHLKPKPRYLSLQPSLRNGERAAVLANLDPFLTQFESEYQYLFKRVYDVSRLPQGEGLENYYGMPNIARRLLESYLAYRVPGHSGELLKKLNEIDGDKAAKTRVLRFLHTFSHGDIVAAPDHDPSILAETQAVFRDVLDLLRTNDVRHYQALVQLCEAET